MTAALSVALVVAVAVIGLLLIERHRVAQRLVDAIRRLEPDVAPLRGGLDDALVGAERAVDRALGRDEAAARAGGRLADALAVIPQGLVVFDESGALTFANHLASSYLGGGHGEALVEEAITELAGVGTDSTETRTVNVFGPPTRTLELRGIGLSDGEVPTGAIVVIDDVTDRRRLEAVRRDFVANISHELKTPVGALSLLAETLLAEDDPEVVERLAQRLLDEADRVSRTIDDLLELSRIESGEAHALTEVPVHLFVAEAVARVRPAAEQQDITIEVDEPSPRLLVEGDRRQLVSATFNLLENAVKYSDPGGSVRVWTSADWHHVAINVQDHGVGIPQRDRERIFERFYRVDRARSRDTGGTGLGLAIVRHVVANHAGEVRVESTEGVGSTFTLRLPTTGGLVAVTEEAG